MWKVSGLLSVLIICSAAIAADSPSSRSTAAVAKYREAVAAADREHNKAVEQARETLIKDIKGAEKLAMKQGDLDAANACESLIKSNASVDKGASSAKAPEEMGSSFAGATLKAISAGTFTFAPDGSMASTVDGPGHWKQLSANSVLVTFNDHLDWVRIFTFDENDKTFKSGSFQQRQTGAGSYSR
jgi:hypothetical protein